MILPASTLASLRISSVHSDDFNSMGTHKGTYGEWNEVVFSSPEHLGLLVSLYYR